MTDLISRADAIEAVGKYKEEHGYTYYDCACDIENDLKQLPSAKPKTGKWEEKYIEDAPPFLKHRFYCSNCGEWITYGTADFCCHCGADMRGSNNA